MPDASDQSWMARALQLAEHGRGKVEPNPLVGAVLVRDGLVIGEGRHERFGHNHAEINALAAAGARAEKATLYVTLEPCCHHGKTPPCTDALIRAKVRRVVAAMSDPFPQVGGQGMAALRNAGIEVEVGVCESEARRLNAPYVKLLTTGRPFVHAKWAMSLDGKIATRTGDSRWISNETSRKRAHELRGRVDGILIGIATALTDDPLLTARPRGLRVATRIILDSQLRLPPTSQLARTAGQVPVLLVATPSAPEGREAILRGLGCEVVRSETAAMPPLVEDLLIELGRRRMTNLLVEGGAAVLGSFLDAGQVDEIHVFLAPLLVGGTQGKSPVDGHGAARIGDALRLAHWEMEPMDGDFYIHGRLK